MNSEAIQPPALVPAYYWAGAGSAVVHRLKGFDFGIDEDAYAHAYDADRLQWLRDVAGVTFAFLSYNWGLPPEREVDDWDGFERAAATCHDLGMQVAAYVQPSNALDMGSYASKGWWARSAKGKRIPYYNGRFFTCLNHPEWRAEVLARVADAVQRGADAIFLDNCTFGGMPIPLSKDYTAFAGCYCHRCQRSFRRWQEARQQAAMGIPRQFRPMRDPVAREFAHWRAWVLTEFLREIRDHIDRIAPGTVLLTNTVGAVNVNTYNLFGVDLPELAHVVDWLFVENLQSPRTDRERLVHNSGTFKLLQSLKPGAPTLSISYERGIGVDDVPGERTFSRTVAEALASGGVPVIRAAEYIVDRTWTLLKPGEDDVRLAAARRVLDFAAGRPEIFEGRRPSSPVAVYVPPGLGWRGDIYPDEGADFLAVIQALVGASIPFRVTSTLAELEGIRALILPAGSAAPPGFRGLALGYADLGVRKRRRSLLDYFRGPLEPVVGRVGPMVVDAYFQRVRVRRFIDRLDLLFRLVFHDQFAHLSLSPRAASLLRSVLPCTVVADGPVYADLWENDAGTHLHLVNYDDHPVRVTVGSASGAPEVVASTGLAVDTASASFVLDEYVVMTWPRPVAVADPSPAREVEEGAVAP